MIRDTITGFTEHFITKERFDLILAAKAIHACSTIGSVKLWHANDQKKRTLAVSYRTPSGAVRYWISDRLAFIG